MIKIEKISAEKATVVRSGLRQPLILHSHINEQELATINAESGVIVYSVDEAQIKELTFQAEPLVAAAVVKPVIKQPVIKTTKRSVEPPSTEATAD